MKMIIKHRTIGLFIVLLFIFNSFSFAGNIVYPWRAAPAFAECGGGFSALYNNITFADIDSVVFTGPYNRVQLTIDSVSVDRFVYDTFTQKDVNNKIWLSVPKSAPEELYDLLIYSNGETHVSRKSVKVVREFKPSHRFIHISDTHVTRAWVGDGDDGYAKELELLDRFVDLANIIAPDFIINTGDVIMHYTRVNADSTGWGGDKLYDADLRPLVEEKYRNYYAGAKGFSGVHGFNAPIFSLPGNHDSYGVNRKDHMAMSSQWNDLCGLRVYGFSYGDTRVLAADDFLGDPVNDIPDASPMSGLQGQVLESFLAENGDGALRIMAQHRPDRIDTTFMDKHKIGILLNGHNHTPFHEYVGVMPTLSIRSGTVCRSGEVNNWQENLGFFRIFYIDGSEFTFTEPLRFCENPTDDYRKLKLNLTLEFNNSNDGSITKNEAVITNRFPVDLPGCKVRFVMKKGEYRVEGGKVNQIIQTQDKTVVDVYTDVNKGSEKTVRIFQL